MNSVTELSRDALKKVRAIVEDLKVQSFEEEVKSVETILNNANLKFTFHNKGGAKSLNPAKQSILSMILREAINNIVKHAQATKVVGELQEEQNTLKMTISDNGIGIPIPLSEIVIFNVFCSSCNSPTTLVACACFTILLIASLRIIDNIDCFAGLSDFAPPLL